MRMVFIFDVIVVPGWGDFALLVSPRGNTGSPRSPSPRDVEDSSGSPIGMC